MPIKPVVDSVVIVDDNAAQIRSCLAEARPDLTVYDQDVAQTHVCRAQSTQLSPSILAKSSIHFLRCPGFTAVAQGLIIYLSHCATRSRSSPGPWAKWGSRSLNMYWPIRPFFQPENRRAPRAAKGQALGPARRKPAILERRKSIDFWHWCNRSHSRRNAEGFFGCLPRGVAKREAKVTFRARVSGGGHLFGCAGWLRYRCGCLT